MHLKAKCVLQVVSLLFGTVRHSYVTGSDLHALGRQASYRGDALYLCPVRSAMGK